MITMRCPGMCAVAPHGIHARKDTTRLSLPVPWAGDDRTRRGARDISSLCWVLRRLGWEISWPSSGLASNVAMCLAFPGRVCSS
jgi:hypothetical protein